LKNVLYNINHFKKDFGRVYLERSRKAQPDNGSIKTKALLFLLIFLYLITYSSHLLSQTLIPTAETAFESQLPFNTEYIKKQKIKSITFDIIDKKDLQVAEDKGLLNYYEFNPNGLLTRFYYTSIIKVIQKEYHVEAKFHRRKKISNAYSYSKNEYVYDTVSTNYFYNELNNLKLKRYNDGVFYESYYYNYSPDGKVEKEKRCKETNVSENKSEFKLGSQLIISEESFKYINTGKNQYKKICHNDEGRPYKEIIYTLNDVKQPISINEQYTVAWITQNSSFTYNAKGQLTKAIYKSNSNGDMEQLRTYEYDANDCLLTEKQYKNGILLKEISYVTDTNKKVNSYIIRDPNNKSLRIVKLLYQY
jgi:hypothetical protein